MENLSKYQKEIVKWIKRTRPTVYTTCNHVSSSGMLRVIDCFVIRDNKPVSVVHLIETYELYKQDNLRRGVRVSGCGMDMGFAVVYALSDAIFPKGFKYRKNEYHRNGDPGKRDRDGGYALKQEWL